MICNCPTDTPMIIINMAERSFSGSKPDALGVIERHYLCAGCLSILSENRWNVPYLGYRTAEETPQEAEEDPFVPPKRRRGRPRKDSL